LAQLEEQLQRDIDRIRDKVREMADLALRGLEDSVNALLNGDCRLAYAAILRDSRIDDLESVVDTRCVEFMVRHIPVAKHLRFSHSVAKIVSELERVGDYAESINRQAILLSQAPHKPDLAPYQRLARVAIDAVRQAVRAFLDEDLDLASATWRLDNQANGLHQEIYRSLVGQRPTGTEDLSTLFALLSVANRFERVADQASNICEEVFYIVTGKVVKHELRRDVQILFVSSPESCRGVMAEAIAKTIAGKHFEFFSAVASEGAPDPRAVDALERRGIPQPETPPPSVGSLEDIGRFRVVVAIGKEAARAMPKLAFRTILLEWDVPDPLIGVDDAESLRRGYERAFDDVVERLTELIRSLHGTIENTKPGVNVHA
jgi:phosphate transport system protein